MFTYVLHFPHKSEWWWSNSQRSVQQITRKPPFQTKGEQNRVHSAALASWLIWEQLRKRRYKKASLPSWFSKKACHSLGRFSLLSSCRSIDSIARFLWAQLSCHEFMNVTALSCAEDTILQHPSTASAFYSLSASFFVMNPEPCGKMCNTNVAFVAEHSRVTYSLPFNHLWVFDLITDIEEKKASPGEDCYLHNFTLI